MKTKSVRCLSQMVRVLVLLPFPSLAQGSLGDGTFQDLNFDSANVLFLPSQTTFIQAGPALPGWTASVAGIPQTEILYNGVTLGGTAISLEGPPTPTTGANYRMLLTGSTAPGLGTVAISQTGTIPVGANSIQFQSSTSPLSLPPYIAAGVTINGQALTLSSLGFANNLWTYGGNISQYAGKSVDLQFYSMSGVQGGMFYFDNISFSTQGVPEPAPIGLFGIAGLVLAVNLRRKRS